MISLKASRALFAHIFYIATQALLSNGPEMTMTNEKTSISNDDTADGPNATGNQKAAKSFISDERRFLDALEDDEVREILRGLRQSQEHPPTKKTLAK